MANPAPTILAYCGTNIAAADLAAHTAGCPKCSYKKGTRRSWNFRGPFEFCGNAVKAFALWLVFATIAVHIIIGIAAVLNAVTGLYLDALGWPSMIGMVRRAIRLDSGWRDSKIAIKLLVSYIGMLET